ncbi:Outer membrane porin F precursor [Falsiruegeria litorea R37]|uniref:Outer membrane porin F n=1 Tax=Falsiruegeria litorea R37 TaxID=1200284 RepID=A0A1Y5RHC0_9RHOB|nr:OmpA family protein [Falsiruegeria litorea]SLN14703.1 Outer membrane porin F precursor [Falsiruegeria litorea R37]
MIRSLALCAVFAALPAAAQELALPPEARQLTNRDNPLDSYELPIAVWDGTGVPSREVQGRVVKRTWRMSVGSKTTLQVFAALRNQIEAQGYDVLLDCPAEACGGFDFRFGTEVVPSPDMYVSIRDYRFMSAIREDEVLSLLVSRNPPDAYVQVITVTPAEVVPLEVAQTDEAEEVPEPGIAANLEASGHVILNDLEFETGADALGNGPFAVLSELADWLKQDEARRVVLVGHTDNIGLLERNTALSQRRAEAVKARLIEAFEVAAEQLETAGAGYLAPVDSNATPEGREANRRVEAVVLPVR